MAITLYQNQGFNALATYIDESCQKNPRQNSFYVHYIDGRKAKKRLGIGSSGRIIELAKGKRNYGYAVSISELEMWKNVFTEKDEKGSEFYLLRFIKRLEKVKRILEKTGLWPSILNSIKKMMDDEDLLKNFCDVYDKEGSYAAYKAYREIGDVNLMCNLYGMKSPLKKPSYYHGYTGLEEMTKNAIENKQNARHRWYGNYDYSVEVSHDKGCSMAWYSEEFKGCGNGHYYLLLDAETALFCEDD